LAAPSALAQERRSPVVVAPVVEEAITSTQSFVGTITPLRRATIGSAVDGRVSEFPLNEGDRVRRGEPLAQLLTETINWDLKSAEGELEYRKQLLAEMKNGVRPEELEQAKARMLAAEAKMKYTTVRRDRIVRLFNTQRTATEEQRDEAIYAAAEAEQAHADVKAAYDMAVAGPRKEQIAQAEAEVERQSALVEKLKDQIGKHTIVSRFDGYLTTEYTEVGQWVSQGAPVAEVVALDQVDVLVNIVEQHVPFIRVGMTVPIDVPALPGRRFEGKVALVVPQADLRTRTFPVKIRINNEFVDDQPVIKAGMTARATLAIGANKRSTLVPKDAVVHGGKTPLVFVYLPSTSDPQQGTVEPVAVKLGDASGGRVAVEGAIKAGMSVVIEGNERLPPVKTDKPSLVRLVESPGDPTTKSRQP
jgi:RND family efflux transporter MFP subunit